MLLSGGRLMAMDMIKMWYHMSQKESLGTVGERMARISISGIKVKRERRLD